MKIVRNTYPRWPKVIHGKVGDVCNWQRVSSSLCLVRVSDGKTIYSRDWKKDDDRPVVGIIAQVISKGWVLEIAR